MRDDRYKPYIREDLPNIDATYSDNNLHYYTNHK